MRITAQTSGEAVCFPGRSSAYHYWCFQMPRQLHLRAFAFDGPHQSALLSDLIALPGCGRRKATFYFGWFAVIWLPANASGSAPYDVISSYLMDSRLLHFQCFSFRLLSFYILHCLFAGVSSIFSPSISLLVPWLQDR